MLIESTHGFAVLSAGIAVALATMLFLYSLGLRFARIWHDRAMARRRQRWWPIIAGAALRFEPGNEQVLAPLYRGSRLALLREWCRFRVQIKGGSGNTLGLLADELGLRRVARRMLRGRSKSNRLLAIQALGFLRDSHSWDELARQLEHSDVAIAITAATALVHIHPEKAISLIIPMISYRPTWPRTQLGRILNLAGPLTVTGPLCEAIEQADSDVACRLLQFIESATINDVDSLAARLLLKRTEPTLVAALLKSVRGQLPVQMIEKFACHKVWFVRMQAASLLGRSGRREDYGVLEPLLSDQEWWVRYRSAQAIVKLPFLGPKALRKLLQRQQDRYAQDILRQAMAEVGLA